ncbi:MAG: hypothetical protein Q4E56_04045 [Pseudomonadota bacterium]|nr:hypothetical protein [Pseudomonadota bacterium]
MAIVKVNFAGIGKKIKTECAWDFGDCPVLNLERSWAHEYAVTRLHDDVVVRVAEFNNSAVARMNATIAQNLCANCRYKKVKGR